MKYGISVVIPLYQCHDSLDELHQRLTLVASQLFDSFEIIYVNDGSTDQTAKWMRSMSKSQNVKMLTLSRNFGQHPAIFAGLSHAKYEYVCVMDGDLQDQPEELVNLCKHIKEDPELGSVVGRRLKRLDGRLKIFFSNFFYKTLAYLTDTQLQPGIANFGIYRSKVIREVLLMGDYNLFFPVMVQWVGFKYLIVDVKHDSRKYGKSAYSFLQLIKLGIAVMISFSNKPIYLIIKLGLALAVISILSALIVIFGKIYYGTTMPGWASLIVVTLLFGAIQITIAGVIGLYISSTFDRVKGRKRYILEDDNTL